VQGFQIDGISLANSARNVSLVSVTCRGNGRCGISVGGASSTTLDECLVGDNGQAQLLTLPCSETHIRNSRLLSNTAPGWMDQGGRVYLDDRQVQGGLDEVPPPTPQPTRP
jgi:parallel beta-helix repeat protein